MSPALRETESAPSMHAVGRDGKRRQGTGLGAAAELVCKEVDAEKVGRVEG